MTIGELRKALDAYPAERRVLVQGYEGGWIDLTEVNQARVALNVRAEESWMFGPHDVVEVGGDELAVLLPR